MRSTQWFSQQEFCNYKVNKFFPALYYCCGISFTTAKAEIRKACLFRNGV